MTITRAFMVLLTSLAMPSYAADSVEVLRVPEGGLYPQALVDSAAVVHLIYVKGDPQKADVFYVRSEDACKTWSAPLRVNSQPQSVILIGTIRGPQLAIGQNNRVHVAWMGSSLATPKVNGEAPMLYTRLDDNRNAFEPQRNLIQHHPGLDGGGSVAADAHGRVYVAWHAPDTIRSEADRQIWVARSEDGGNTFTPEYVANPAHLGACGCCGLKISVATNGDVFLLYRSATEMIHRDIHLLRSVDHALKFTDVMSDPWEVAQCVMSTSAIASSVSSNWAAWETRKQIAMTHFEPGALAGKTVTAPGEGRDRRHPALAVREDGVALLAWTEGTGWNKGGIIAWQIYDRSGKTLGEVGYAQGLPAWSSPACLALPGNRLRVIY